MSPRWLLLGIVASGLGACLACEEVNPLKPHCGQPCIEIDGKPLVSGEHPCAGVLICHEDGTEACAGYVPWFDEVCNGEDDDCDGLTDEDLYLAPKAEGNPCADRPGVCGDVPAYCTDAEWQCGVVSGQGPELCNGKDDDCDGETDEGLSVLGYRYDGPPETANVGECRAGVIECIDGTEQFRGQVLPTQSETCNDDRDTDCDGQLDPPVSEEAHDIVLVLDYSGSMDLFLADVTTAVCEWSNSGGQIHRFAAIAVARDSRDPYNVYVMFDFLPAQNACSALRSSTTSGTYASSGEEYMFDGMMLAHQAPISYSGAPKNMIVFTDEVQQDGNYNMADVQQDCQDNGYSPIIFTVQFQQAAWGPLVATCGGSIETLGFATIMSQRLIEIFRTFC